MIECPSCNAQNPNGSISCTVCGGELPMSNPVAVLNKPKMAVFHVEEAILDNAAGERIAKRKGLSGKRFEREVASNVEKAVSRAGVRDYVNKLSRDGYTIAFITNMEPTYKSRLQARLRDLGYPVMADTMGPLVLSGGSQDNIRSLANRYDITFSFGTSGAGTAKQLNVPGVYATVGDYIGNASNPYIAPQATPSPYSLSGLRPEPTPAPYTLANPANCGCGQDPCITYGPMKNAPFDIKDAAGMTEAERQAALRQYQTEQFALRQAEQARRDAEVAAESARKARLAANTPLLKSSIKRWAETYLDPQMPQIVAEMKKPPHFSAYAPIGTGDGFRGEALTILKDIHQNSRDAGFDMYAYLSDLYGVNVSLSFHGRWGADKWKIRFDDNPAGYVVPPPMPPMTNPPPKPRRQTSKKTGKKRRESAKKYFDRLMGNKMMNKEFPDNSQRSAVALRYVKEEYGQRGVNSVTKTWNPIENPIIVHTRRHPEARVGTMGVHSEEKLWVFPDDRADVAQDYADQLNRSRRDFIAKRGEGAARFTKEAFVKSAPFGPHGETQGLGVTLSGGLSDKGTMYEGRYVHGNPTTEGLPIYSGQPTGAKNLGMVSAVVQVGRGFMKDIGEGLQDFYRALIGGRQSMTEKRMEMAVAEMHRDLTNAVEQKGGNAIGNVRLDYEYPSGSGRSLDLTLIATADALKVRGGTKKNPVLSNVPFDVAGVVRDRQSHSESIILQNLAQSDDRWREMLQRDDNMIFLPVAFAVNPTQTMTERIYRVYPMLGGLRDALENLRIDSGRKIPAPSFIARAYPGVSDIQWRWHGEHLLFQLFWTGIGCTLRCPTLHPKRNSRRQRTPTRSSTVERPPMKSPPHRSMLAMCGTPLVSAGQLGTCRPRKTATSIRSSFTR